MIDKTRQVTISQFFRIMNWDNWDKWKLAWDESKSTAPEKTTVSDNNTREIPVQCPASSERRHSVKK